MSDTLLALVETPVLLGESPVMVALRTEIGAAARTNAKVLVLGETGVGKEVAARLIHLESERRSQSFIPVNCSGIPETLLASELFGHTRGSFTGAYRDKRGVLRQADRGTLFLDELGEMSLAMQAMLLRFTETGEIQPVGAEAPVGKTNARLITATNRDLLQMVADGNFREDLYYRLNVIRIRVPPVRERGKDVLLLFRHYLEQASTGHCLPCPELTPEAVELLLNYGWPGNVRELRNMTEQLVLRELPHAVAARDLPREMHEVLARPAVVSPPVVRGAAPRPPDQPASTDEPVPAGSPHPRRPSGSPDRRSWGAAASWRSCTVPSRHAS